jgi:hypothetical protein
MKTGRIAPARRTRGVWRFQDWFRTASRLSTGKIYRSSIVANRLVVARRGRNPVALATAEIDMDLVLALDGWRPRLEIRGADAWIDVQIDASAIDLSVNGSKQRMRLSFKSPYDPLVYPLLCLTPVRGMSHARFSLDCTASLEPCLIGVIHILCILLEKQQARVESP